MTHDFEIEFEHDKKTYITTGQVDIWSENVIGTTFGEETEILVDTGISHIEIDSIDMVDHGDYQCMLNDKEIKEVAIEAISDRYN